jgi:hypothetical protein
MVLKDAHSEGNQDRTDLKRRFTDWVRQSPLHLKEFMELHAAYCGLNEGAESV